MWGFALVPQFAAWLSWACPSRVHAPHRYGGGTTYSSAEWLVVSGSQPPQPPQVN
jgi:hypothetical protein